MSEKIEPQIRCTCCGGTGKYNPLTGPAEPCGTCKGEGVIPNPALTETKFNDTPDTAVRVYDRPFGMGTAAVERALESGAEPKKFYMISTPGDRSSRLQEFIKQYQGVRVAYTNELLGESWLPSGTGKMPDVNQRRDSARCVLMACAQAADRKDLTLIEQFETQRDLMIAKKNYMAVKTESFAELYGGGIQKHDVAMEYVPTIGWVRASSPVPKATMSPDEYTAYRKKQEFMDNLRKMNYGEGYQSESRIHRKGMKSGDISIKFSVPPDLHASMEKVEAAFKTLTKTLVDLGIKIEVGCAKVGQLVRSLDPGSPSFMGYLSSQCVPEPTIADYAAADAKATADLWSSYRDKFMNQKVEAQVFDESSIILPVFHKDDPRVAMMERVMKMETDRVLKSTPPLFYDPESGAITPCPATGRRINSQSLKPRPNPETSSSEPLPGAERLP